MQFGDFFFDGDKRKIYEAPTGFSYTLDGDGYRIYTPDDEPSAPQSLIFTTYVLWSRYVDYMDAIEWARKALSISGGAWRYTDQYGEDKYSLIDLRLINDWAFVPSNYPHATYIKGNLFPNEATNIDFDTSRITVQGVSPRIMFSDAGERSAEDTETAAQNTTSLQELWKLAGLDITNPMTVTPTTRVVDNISLTITGDGKIISTVTRQ